jgi:hypothetical protein
LKAELCRLKTILYLFATLRVVSLDMYCEYTEIIIAQEDVTV